MQAWMRSRGEGATEVFTADTMAAKFGVVYGSYDAVPLPRLDAHIVSCVRLHVGRISKRHALSTCAAMYCADANWARGGLGCSIVLPSSCEKLQTGGALSNFQRRRRLSQHIWRGPP